jgi:CubicO group peptidase (beta-lactamase class C family)
MGPAPRLEPGRVVVRHTRSSDRSTVALSRARRVTRVNPRRFVNALMPRGIEDVLSAPELMDAEIPALNGFFTARSLAKLYAMLAGSGEVGGIRLLSPETLRRMAVVHSSGPDLVLVLPMGWRLGHHSAFTTRGTMRGALGHFGFGGSGGWADTRRDLALAMVCNRGTGTPIGDLRMAQLGAAVARAPGVCSPA